MIIDTHQHVFWHNKDDKDLVADMDEQGIDLAWLLSWDIPIEDDNPDFYYVLNAVHVRDDGTHPGIPLSDLMIAKKNYPDRFVLGYCPNPKLDNAPALFESAYHMHGVRVCGEQKFRIPFDDPRCLNLYRKAGELNCPVVLHLDVPYLTDGAGAQAYQKNWYGGTIANLERAMKACPETNFLGHAPGFWREISGDANQDPSNYPKGPVTPNGRLYRLFDENPNLYGDMSAGSGLFAFSRDVEHGKAFINRYADRLLFARDFYGGDLNTFLQSLNLDADVQEKIYCTNAQKLLA